MTTVARVGRLLVDGAAVLTVDDDFTIHDPGWVHVVDGMIDGVGAGAAPAELRQAADRVIDAAGSVQSSDQFSWIARCWGKDGR